MLIIAKAIFNLLLFVIWPLHFVYHAFLMNKRKKRIRDLKMLITQVEHRWRWDRDLLTDRQNERLRRIREKADELLANKPEIEAIESFQKKALADLKSISPEKPGLGVLKEWLELIVVVLGVVMGARALFLQPFKIPTGSMQPTLNGINFYESNAASDVNLFTRIFDYANYSWRYVDAEIKEDGRLERIIPRTFKTTKNPWFIFFPDLKLKIGRHYYKLPGESEKVKQYIAKYWRTHYPYEFGQAFPGGKVQYGSYFFKKGQKLFCGYLELGDHLFVDRVRLNFVNPQRGDITVFITDGITNEGKALRGKFFIKRLVGLPGDELKIKDHKLYVKEEGKNSFTLVDGSYHKAFDRMYSQKGGYQGYRSPRGRKPPNLGSEQETFKLGADEYFMLGDNSTNSQDSRFWGIVPRKNIIGRANFVYWPFSRRWGFADLVNPEDFPTPIYSLR